MKVINYLERTVELEQTYAELPISVSLHPSGLHLIVGFQDKLRVMNLLMDDMRVFKELPIKNCSETQFSHGGSHFAAVLGSVIMIYNFWTCELLHTIRGHNGPVKSVYWSLDDTSIVSAGMDGAVYERRLDEGRRHQEWVQKSCHFSSAVISMDGKIYAVGDDQYIKEITDSTVNKEMDTSTALSQVVISYPPQRMLFVATEHGIVRAFKFPLTGESSDFVGHRGLINRMRITPDDGHVITAGEDGTVVVFEVKERDGRLAKRDRADAVPFAQEILVTKSDLEEKTSAMADLKSQVDELTIHNAYQLRLHDITYQDKLKEVTEKFNQQLDHDRTKYEMLKDEKQDMELEYEEKIKHLEDDHARCLHDQDIMHQQSIMDEVKSYHELEGTLEAETHDFERRSRDREIRHQQMLQGLKDSFVSKLEEEQSDRLKITMEKDLVSRKFQETKDQLEQDTDKEIEELKAKYDANLHMEKDATLRLKGENGIMKKKFSALKKDIEDQREEIRAMMDKEAQLHSHIGQLQNEIKAHKHLIDERDATIGERETEIYDLKKNNQELEKFKFVLDFQIKELKRQIEPRENEIERMKEEVMEMDEELERYHKENGELTATMDELKAALAVNQSIIKRERQSFRDTELLLGRLLADVEEMASRITEPGPMSLYASRVMEEHKIKPQSKKGIDGDIDDEYARQMHYLEKTSDTLKKKLQKDMRVRRSENVRIMQENVGLLKEINDLRRQLKQMRLVQRQKELDVDPNSYDRSLSRNTRKNGREMDEKEAESIIAAQRKEIEDLRQVIESKKHSAMLHKHTSRERLPPIDDFAGRAPSGVTSE